MRYGKVSFRRGGLAVLFLALAGLSLGAQDLQLTAFVDYFGGIEVSEGYENLRTQIFLRPQLSGADDDLNLEWTLSGTLWAQPWGQPESINKWDILHEAYVLFPFQYAALLLGQKIVTYGFADIFGPMNALHSTNAVPLLMDESYDAKRPDPMVQLKLYPSFEDTVQITYVPVTRPDKERSDDVYLAETMDTVRFNREPYLVDPDDLHSLFIHYSRYGLNADYQLFYGWYTEHTPDFVIPASQGSVAYDITAVYNKKHTFGVAYSTRLGNWTFSQDFAFNLTSDLAGTDPGAQNSDIVVNSQLLMNLPGNILSQFTLYAAYIINHGKHDTGSDEEAADYLAAQFQDFHTQPLPVIGFIVGHFEKTFLRERLKTQLNLGLLYPNVYIAPRIAYSITDYTSLEVGADYMTGNPPPEGDLRRNPVDDNFYVRLVYRY